MTHLIGHNGCEEGHTCQRPSGRLCYEKGCDEAAGTRWGPYWCPDHDSERLDRVDRNLQGLLAKLDNDSQTEKP